MSDDHAQELIRLRRIVWALVAGMAVSLAVGIAGIWKARAVEAQLIRFRIQVGTEFASLGTNPEAYFAQMRQFSDGLRKAGEDAMQEVRRKKAAGEFDESK